MPTLFLEHLSNTFTQSRVRLRRLGDLEILLRRDPGCRERRVHARASVLAERLGDRPSDLGDLEFQVYRPAKTYSVLATRADGHVEVTEIRMGMMATLDVLHGAGRIPGVALMTAWWLFTEASWVFMLLASASGVYLWARRGRGAARWASVGAATVGFFLLTYLVVR